MSQSAIELPAVHQYELILLAIEIGNKKFFSIAIRYNNDDGQIFLSVDYISGLPNAIIENITRQNGGKHAAQPEFIRKARVPYSITLVHMGEYLTTSGVSHWRIFSTDDINNLHKALPAAKTFLEVNYENEAYQLSATNVAPEVYQQKINDFVVKMQEEIGNSITSRVGLIIPLRFRTSSSLRVEEVKELKQPKRRDKKKDESAALITPQSLPPSQGTPTPQVVAIHQLASLAVEPPRPHALSMPPVSFFSQPGRKRKRGQHSDAKIEEKNSADPQQGYEVFFFGRRLQNKKLKIKINRFSILVLDKTSKNGLILATKQSMPKKNLTKILAPIKISDVNRIGVNSGIILSNIQRYIENSTGQERSCYSSFDHLCTVNDLNLLAKLLNRAVIFIDYNYNTLRLINPKGTKAQNTASFQHLLLTYLNTPIRPEDGNEGALDIFKADILTLAKPVEPVHRSKQKKSLTPAQSQSAMFSLVVQALTNPESLSSSLGGFQNAAIPNGFFAAKPPPPGIPVVPAMQAINKSWEDYRREIINHLEAVKGDSQLIAGQFKDHILKFTEPNQLIAWINSSPKLSDDHNIQREFEVFLISKEFALSNPPHSQSIRMAIG